MIYDNLRNCSLYFSFSEKLEKALSYLSSTNFTNVEAGRYDIDGENVYALVSEYNTKPLSAAKWESHRKYIDVQFMVIGKEKMGYTEAKKVITLEEYNSDKDYTIHKGEGNFLNAEEGHFAIFFPTDIHMPGVAINIPKPVKKVVVKVRTDYVEEVNPIEEAVPEIEEPVQAAEEPEPVKEIIPEDNPSTNE